MRTIFSCILTFLLFLSFPVGAQDSEEDIDFDAKFEEGKKLIEEQIYDQALKVWKQLEKVEPQNANVNYMVGFCYMKLGEDKKEALPYLTKASNDITKRYNPFSPNETSAPPKALYYYGRALHLNMKLDSAESTFTKFREMTGNRHFLFNDAGRQMEMVRFAKKQVANPKDIQIENIGKPINTEYPEYSPVISVDEQVLYFTSRRPKEGRASPMLNDDGLPFEDIYASYKNNAGKWGEPEPVSFNTDGNEATISVSADGQQLFFYKDNTGNGDIYRSRLMGDEWGEPKPMGSDINTDAWETHGVLSADGNTFYFVSNREGGEGGRDIYRCKRLPTGQWSKAMNVGPPINTPYDEDAPFIHPDGKTLYFSSKGHKSMGGFDIFFTEKKDNGEWTEPKNIGYPINTVDNDVFFVTSADGERGYYSSIKEEGYGDKDIYQISLARSKVEDLAVLKGFINVPKGEDIPENTRIFVTDLATSKTKEYTPRQRDGVFVSILPPCKDYRIEYRVGEKVINKERVSIPCNTSYQEINKEIYLNPVNLDSSKIREKRIDTTYQWQVLKDEKPYDRSGLVVKYLRENGTVLYTENLEENGYFQYFKLDGDDPYIFEVQTDEPQLCQDLTLVLKDNMGREVARTIKEGGCKFKFEGDAEKLASADTDKDKDTPGDEVDKDKDEDKDDKDETTDDKGTDDDVASDDKTEDKDKEEPAGVPFFETHYGYNAKGLSSKDPKFQDFLDRVKKVVDEKGAVTIDIEASASKVPTKTYGTNQNLADERAKAAKKHLLDDLKGLGVNASKVKFGSVDSKVQGPPFEKGNISPRSEYRKYQYVELRVRE